MEQAKRVISIPLLRWRGIVSELRRRGDRVRESGAFLLSTPWKAGQAARIKHVAYYDDLDPGCLASGGVDFHAAGYQRLWALCKQLHMQVIADIHTHPGRSVGQSHIDAKHPMLPTAGHVAMIAPYFGHTSPWSLYGVGIYDYLGNHQWVDCNSPASSTIVRISIF